MKNNVQEEESYKTVGSRYKHQKYDLTLLFNVKRAQCEDVRTCVINTIPAGRNNSNSQIRPLYTVSILWQRYSFDSHSIW